MWFVPERGRERERDRNYLLELIFYSAHVNTYRIAELLVHLLDNGEHIFQFVGKCVRIEVGHAKQRADLRQNGRHLELQMEQLAESLLDDLRKREQTQCVSGRRCVEDDRGKVHGLDQSNFKQI